MKQFKVQSPFQPSGDQPQAIELLAAGVNNGLSEQVLLGVTGSGKTYTIANVIERVQRPTLVLAHNKTLAAQLCAELKSFFPDNAVEYFVSYYDYYRPEAYIPHTDTYLEKDSAVNEEIDRLRHSATSSIAFRRDTIIVASVSCIYSLGNPIDYKNMDSLERQNAVYKIWENTGYSNILQRNEERVNKLSSDLKGNPLYYVLNLIIDSCNNSDKQICLLPDTSDLPFHLFSFDKNLRVKFIVYVYEGRYSGTTDRYRSSSSKISKNAPRVFKKILKKRPKYLLCCDDLEGMNTILYELNDKIYVYRILQMKEYELNEYLQRGLYKKWWM